MAMQPDSSKPSLISPFFSFAGQLTFFTTCPSLPHILASRHHSFTPRKPNKYNIKDVQKGSKPQATIEMTRPESGEVDRESPGDDPAATPDFDALFSELDDTSLKLSETVAESDDHRVDDDGAIALATQAMQADIAQPRREEGVQEPKCEQSREEDDTSTVDQTRGHGMDTEHMKRSQSPNIKVESEDDDIGELWQQASAA